MKKKTKKKLAKVNDFFKTLKPILIFSFIINVILLGYIYYLKVNNHIYFFSGTNEYVSIDSGTLSMNYDLNYLMGNNIQYIAEKDLKTKEIKLGYYVMEDDGKLKNIITHYEKFDEVISLKETLENITSLNVSESAKEKQIFNKINSKNLETKLYFMMEIKLKDGETLVSKLQLDVSKIK